MIGLLQRVSKAAVVVDGEPVGEIGTGLLVLVGVQPDDTEVTAERLVQRILSYRVFSDSDGRMNQSVTDVDGGVLLVPQFTLAADTSRGNRPGFSTAAEPAKGRLLFHHALEVARKSHHRVEQGVFGADMQVSLVNEGPVTFWLHVR